LEVVDFTEKQRESQRCDIRVDNDLAVYGVRDNLPGQQGGAGGQEGPLQLHPTYQMII
jgi:hypothetical protein